jgi:hypothetical protein
VARRSWRRSTWIALRNRSLIGLVARNGTDPFHRRASRSSSLAVRTLRFSRPRSDQRAELFIFISFFFAGPRVRVMMASNNSCDWQISSEEHSMCLYSDAALAVGAVACTQPIIGPPCPPCSWMILIPDTAGLFPSRTYGSVCRHGQHYIAPSAPVHQIQLADNSV